MSTESYRDLFHIPKQNNGEDFIYFCGNSLGLQPKSTKAAIEQELEDWKNFGVEGHFHAKNPWMPYHEFLTKAMSNVVGGLPEEVIVMNTLSVNLHLLMVSFYRPTKSRYKIVIESDAFPSDKYAVESQLRFHGYDAEDGLIEMRPRAGESLLREEDIEELLENQGEEIALVLFGNPNYYTGQVLPIKKITNWAHAKGCKIGFDLAHGAGNLELSLHDDGPDFALWCTYKYLNSGPGSLGGCFIHQRHLQRTDIHRFTGWWGHNKETRFNMRQPFKAIPTAEAWQLSNPPILSMAAIKASLEIFDKIGMKTLRARSIELTNYLETRIKNIGNDDILIITPSVAEQRGCQLSIQVKNSNKGLYDKITAEGVIADWRQPDVIRVAPVPLYNTKEDCERFADILSENLD